MRALALLLVVAAPAAAQEAGVQAKVAAVLAEAPPGTRIGLVVTDEAGREIVAIRPDERFVPALEHQDISPPPPRLRCCPSRRPTPAAARRCGWRGATWC